jgi:hypothetical protein
MFDMEDKVGETTIKPEEIKSRVKLRIRNTQTVVRHVAPYQYFYCDDSSKPYHFLRLFVLQQKRQSPFAHLHVYVTYN